jgi:hypothetical protein
LSALAGSEKVTLKVSYTPKGGTERTLRDSGIVVNAGRAPKAIAKAN